MREFKVPKWPKPFREFGVPLYGGRVYIYDSFEKWRQAKQYLTKEPGDDTPSLGKCTFLTSNTGSAIALILVTNGNTGTLVHELAHATFFILDRAGVPVKEGEANEAYCYLLDALFERCCDA